MTTIACIQGPDWVVIGADSQSSGDDGFSIMIPDGKIFKNGPIVFAAAGAVRGINILEHNFTVPESKHKDTDKYITRQLIPAMRNTFLNEGYEMNKAESTVENDNVWIIIVRGQVYRIEEDYAWERTTDNLYVAGSGERFALGAMSALVGSTMVDDVAKAKKIVTKAIQIASKYDSSTGGKISVMVVQEPK